MNLKTYTFSVSIAAIIGLFLAIVPLIRSTLEYRSPSLQLTEPSELSSLEAFVVARSGGGSAMIESSSAWYKRNQDGWIVMYEAAMAQHAEVVRQQVESIRNKAKHNVIAYGTLCGLCVVLLLTHLLWARRISTDPYTGRARA